MVDLISGLFLHTPFVPISGKRNMGLVFAFIITLVTFLLFGLVFCLFVCMFGGIFFNLNTFDNFVIQNIKLKSERNVN